MPSALDQTITVVLPDGTAFAGKYELQLGTVTGLDDLAVRRETGFSVWGLIGKHGEEGGLLLLLAVTVAWLVRKKQFPHTTFEEIASSVGWGQDFDVQWNRAIEDDEGNEPGSESDTPKSSEPSPTSTASTRGKSTG